MSGNERDVMSAEIRLLHDAALAGDGAALCQLANCYFDGIGVAQSYEAALMLYEMACMAGDLDAARNLELCREYKIGAAAQHGTACSSASTESSPVECEQVGRLVY